MCPDFVVVVVVLVVLFFLFVFFGGGMFFEFLPITFVFVNMVPYGSESFKPLLLLLIAAESFYFFLLVLTKLRLGFLNF